MTLDQLRVFVAVAGLGHMTRAAEQLHMTQSTASAAIAALERRHGVRLFDRVGRGLELSAAGRVFLAEASAVLARAEAAARTLEELSGLKRGSLRIAASQTVASYWLPQRMARFVHRYPDVELALQVANTQQVAQLVQDGDADLGFVEGLVDNPLLTLKRVDRDRLSIYAAPDHPLAGRRALKSADLAKAAWVMREPGSGTRAEFETELAARGLPAERLQTLLTLPSNEAVLAAVAAGGALTAISDLAAAPHVAAGSLRRLPFELMQRAFSAVRHRERSPSHAMSAFLGFL